MGDWSIKTKAAHKMIMEISLLIMEKSWNNHGIWILNFCGNPGINGPGHMTKMAATPIYGKNPSKIFSGTGGLISTKLGI